MQKSDKIPVVDIFAGPGGLGEGFSSFGKQKHKFQIVLSIEKEKNAHETLQLRAFYRQFLEGTVPREYYSYLRGEIDRDSLFSSYPKQAERAENEALKAELGETESLFIDNKIKTALNDSKTWVLIGGPPCQAYSLVGRSRNKGNLKYNPEDDKRHFLYLEYLRIIAEHHPPLFVMENVKGILSSKINGEYIFDQIISDLKTPCSVIQKNSSKRNYNYNIYSLIMPVVSDFFIDVEKDPKNYIIKSEDYGIPQTRHRVILLGIREDYNDVKVGTLEKVDHISSKEVLNDLPRVRSGLSKNDSRDDWKKCIQEIENALWLSQINPKIRYEINKTISNIRLPRKNRGSEYIAHPQKIAVLKEWFYDSKLKGSCNHTTRGHIRKDLHRYLYAACFAIVEGRSPILADFPKDLLPDHKNVNNAMKDGSLFSDRFRVQLSSRPSTTITSHISKDGHYYIHYDPTQCRSLTVREAARLQTFPDNYFFCGPRTAQYHQVGNAVPPYLANQIAGIVWNIFEKRI